MRDGALVAYLERGARSLVTFTAEPDWTGALVTLVKDGRLRQIELTTVDGQPGIRDEALTRDGRFLYALHADSRQVFGWEVGGDGSLVPIGAVDGLPATAAGLAAS